MSNKKNVNKKFDKKINNLCKKLYGIGYINEAFSLLNFTSDSKTKEEYLYKGLI